MDPSASPPAPAADFDEYEDEHQEPVARSQRELTTLRRHKDLTAEDIALSHKLWQWGFAFLPFLWIVNYVFFKHTLKEATTPDLMKRNVRRSLVAFCVAMALWLIWLIIFYTNMHGWANPVMLFSPSTNVLKE